MKLHLGDRTVELRPGPAGQLTLDGAALPFRLVRRVRRGGSWELAGFWENRPVVWWVTPDAEGRWIVQGPGGERVLAAIAGREAEAPGAWGPIATPMAGVATEVSVRAGQTVAAGDPLAVIEAMKMRYAITAEAAAVVEAVFVAERALVSVGQVLLRLVPLPGP